MQITPNNIVYLCGYEIGGGGVVWRKVGPFQYVTFESSETELCDGTTVDFTDMSYFQGDSWEWTFEGGTPSSSTEQNPSVTYENGGYFDVSLTITNSDGVSYTHTESDYI
jgi:PKD repeat protein